ncbi:DNA translocase FtsK [Methylobacterium sp. J-067]|uniref:DNA translocase FtsK n=1 Tax=Methylobacterium sp. J-067 TaxID=2836648 RepID=UPI001FB96B89|nr:DNA translocase FtsK [Methylobacterium sp. J-067]MCJ2027813.1 DNA translocase FtsK [Methylobacterium sp. J-067]
MALRASLTRRLAGSAAGPSRVGYGTPGRRAEPSWLTPPTAMVGREGLERAPRPDWADEMAPAAPSWPSDVFDDRAMPPLPRAESRIDRQASTPGVLVRQPRRPDAIAPEEPFVAAASAAPAPLPVAAPAAPVQASSVRYVRTPDSVLQERRQRALEAERVALERARAEAQAAALVVEAERRAREEASAAEPARAESLLAEAGVPRWQQPFVANPGVRYFRTPDRRPVAVAPVPVPAPVAPPEPRDWSDLSDWSQAQPWFGGDDWSSVDVWASLDAPAPALEAAALPAPETVVAVPLDISLLRALPPKPAYVLDRLVRFDQPPRPADAQDNGREPEPVAAPAGKPGLSLVFGPHQAAAPAPVPAPAPRKPAMPCAMAARAAIRAGFQPAPVVPAAPVPVAAPVAAPMPAHSEERVVIPLAPRPVLLRGRSAPAPEPTPEPEVVEIQAAPVEEIPAPVAAAPEAAPANLPLVAARPRMIAAPRHLEIASFDNAHYELPSLDLLALPAPNASEEVDADVLEQNALNLQQTVQDFGVRGDILAVRPGPVVTLYELEPAPGTKSSRVIALSDDIARSMSAVSARVAVVPGRNVIGIELPNEVRETVYLRELLASEDFVDSKHKLALCLGKNIGGEPIIADLARMPHLLVAGTTGSGKSVAINTMILSLLYRLKPEECRLIMVDPKMLELSVYDGIPHLLSPVVIDPKKAVIALKWAVREMEERYKKMSKIAVRNIDGYNARMKEARERGETITRTVQTGVNRETGEVIYEQEEMDLSALPYIVIVVDEMADLMMVAGKDIEGAIQRLAQMARAAGIHLIMATQRPSVDVITGTIKANFPTRISFQVTSKIDSRTILGEMGAEQLLGQGDMLFMAGGGRTTRVHGPFCSDNEVESVVAHLKRQGRPSYLDAVTADDTPEDAPKETGRRGKAAEKAERAEEPEEDAPVFDISAFAAATGGDSDDLYKQAIEVVLRDQKASTSYIQRRLQIGYNRAASIMERMEIEGIVGPANHAGKREILVNGGTHGAGVAYDDD